MDNFKTWLERQAVVDSIGPLNPKLKDLLETYLGMTELVISLEGSMKNAI